MYYITRYLHFELGSKQQHFRFSHHFCRENPFWPELAGSATNTQKVNKSKLNSTLSLLDVCIFSRRFSPLRLVQVSFPYDRPSNSVSNKRLPAVQFSTLCLSLSLCAVCGSNRFLLFAQPSAPYLPLWVCTAQCSLSFSFCYVHIFCV